MQSFSKKQLALLIVVLLLGSTPLIELVAAAKQDAWLAVLLAALAGLLLTSLYIRIQHRSPNAALAELYKIHFGRWIGGGIALAYAVLFAFESMLNVRDVGGLTTMSLLTLAPKWIVMLLIVTAAAYTVSKGIEVFVRVVQLLFPVLVICYFIIIAFMLSNGLMKLDRMLPILESGIENIVKAAFPSLLAVPFGQMIVMLVFWAYVKERQLIGSTTYRSLIGASVFLLFIHILMISVLGPELAVATVLPFLQAVQLIQLSDFIDRLDIVVALLLFIGLYVKITIFYMASVFTLNAVIGAASSFSVLPVGAIIYAASFLEVNVEYARLGIPIMDQIHLVFQVALPLIMLLVGVRKQYKKA